MTRDDILRMAREAGILDPHPLFDLANGGEPLQQSQLERFAQLVAAAERESCAQLCDQLAEKSGYTLFDDGVIGGAEQCGYAIRARSQA